MVIYEFREWQGYPSGFRNGSGAEQRGDDQIFGYDRGTAQAAYREYSFGEVKKRNAGLCGQNCPYVKNMSYCNELHSEYLFYMTIDKMTRMCYNVNKSKELRQCGSSCLLFCFAFYSILSIELLNSSIRTVAASARESLTVGQSSP